MKQNRRKPIRKAIEGKRKLKEEGGGGREAATGGMKPGPKPFSFKLGSMEEREKGGLEPDNIPLKEKASTFAESATAAPVFLSLETRMLSGGRVAAFPLGRR
ncbi:hypothetical protein HPP92_012515 [Vanilla planifolia]|uniref:Uncharacterized protein n=1 Tax=Vanilla planifolia TaxID=51239 RepID=A0A835QVB2_VANPL|nr:hypothetical protein HPP92_012515 [Vanilla planifolia]